MSVYLIISYPLPPCFMCTHQPSCSRKQPPPSPSPPSPPPSPSPHLKAHTCLCTCRGGGNFERQCYVDDPANLFIEDGKLVLQAIRGDHTGVPESEVCVACACMGSAWACWRARCVRLVCMWSACAQPALLPGPTARRWCDGLDALYWEGASRYSIGAHQIYSLCQQVLWW